MRSQNENDSDPTIDFYDAQGNVGSPYFVYIIDQGEHAGGGTSCYFWFESPVHFFRSLEAHGDFWEWRDGWDTASTGLKTLIHSSNDPEVVFSALNDFMRMNAGATLYHWGAFDDLISGDDPFCTEVRGEFRENQLLADEEEESDSDTKLTRAISTAELGAFCEFLSATPS